MNHPNDVYRIEELLRHGADPCMGDCNQVLPIHMIAQYSSCPGLIAMFVGAGANVDASDAFGRNPLDLAINRISILPALPVVRALIMAGAEVNAWNRIGKTPLFHAAMQTRGEAVAVVKELLSAGADARAVDVHGATPLHWIACGNCENSELIRALVDAGVDINAQERDGCTALHCCAEEKKALCLMSALLNAGADLNLRTNDGQTPLAFARRSRNRKGEALLLAAGGRE